jgi:hypothetical protein
VLHHENYFSSTDKHQIFGGTTRFPQSAAAYVRCWRT